VVSAVRSSTAAMLSIWRGSRASPTNLCSIEVKVGLTSVGSIRISSASHQHGMSGSFRFGITRHSVRPERLKNESGFRLNVALPRKWISLQSRGETRLPPRPRTSSGPRNRPSARRCGIVLVDQQPGSATAPGHSTSIEHPNTPRACQMTAPWRGPVA
jgi:hypothetical protein